MKEYKQLSGINAGNVQEPAVSYGVAAFQAESHAGNISDSIMDELLQQNDEVKRTIISRLGESMREERVIRKEARDLEAWKRDMEAKRKELQRKYDLPDDLASLIGCVPPRSDEERERDKEVYLREKYG